MTRRKKFEHGSENTKIAILPRLDRPLRFLLAPVPGMVSPYHDGRGSAMIPVVRLTFLSTFILFIPFFLGGGGHPILCRLVLVHVLTSRVHSPADGDRKDKHRT